LIAERLVKIEFFFDCSSPWTYLAFARIEALAARKDAMIEWKPILVGGVFNAVNDSVYEARAKPNPVKAAYYRKDLQDWARLAGVMIGAPPVFPVRAVTCMRGAFHALDQGRLTAYAKALFEAYWGSLEDISQPDVIAACAAVAGLDAAAVLAYAGSDEAKARLKANTDELIARGGFGSPTMFLGDDMYFGNDRLELVEAALQRARA
jgi:2-hydroxychromene-2-carboxylate isomerase